MKSGYKWLIGGGVVASIAGVITYFTRMKRTSTELEAVNTVNVHEVNPNPLKAKLVLRIDSLLKNPAGGTLTIKKPFVKILYNGSVIGTSKSVNENIVIPPFGEEPASNMLVTVNSLGLLSTASGLFSLITKGTPAKITVKVISTAIVGSGKLRKEIPIEKTQEVLLQNKKTVANGVKK